MAGLIEDYALIGDTETAALVCRDGSIDWWCVPRFDSGAAFAALLGHPEHGRWLIRPVAAAPEVSRRYRGDTLVLETEFRTETGTVAIVDFMPPRTQQPVIVRIVEGRSGTVPMELDLVVRFDYGSIMPWVRSIDGGITLIGGKDGLRFDSPVPLEGRDMRTASEFSVSADDRLVFTLASYPSHEPTPPAVDGDNALGHTEDWWRRWSERCTYDGDYRDDVMRSLITLKALTFAPTGGIVAAATGSLPEQLGGVRNWDYRYCWLRDATFTLHTLLMAGYHEEAQAWGQWLRRAVAGSPGEFQIMYGVRGERRLSELELDSLPGYEGSAPVRIGNAASGQFQLDVFGEIMDVAHVGRQMGISLTDDAWDLQLALMEHLDRVWVDPDDGIWEVRGGRQHFTQSKVMAWVAADRAVKAVEQFDRKGPVDQWRALRERIHREVCEHGFDSERNTFVQTYGGKALDASLLVMAMVGFLPPDDPRIVGTVEAIEKELVVDGFVMRYQTESDGDVDGLPAGEGAFLMTTLWLADNLELIGRRDDALEYFERVRGLRNDVGLLSEEYDTSAGRLVGNFPQAFSHVALANSAANLSLGDEKPSARRASA